MAVGIDGFPRTSVSKAWPGRALRMIVGTTLNLDYLENSKIFSLLKCFRWTLRDFEIAIINPCNAFFIPYNQSTINEIENPKP